MGLCGSAPAGDAVRGSAYSPDAPGAAAAASSCGNLGWSLPGAVVDVCAGPTSSSFFAAGDDGSIFLRDFAGGGAPEVQWQAAGGAAVQRLSWLPATQLLASASRDRNIRLYRQGTAGSVGTLSGHDLSVAAIDGTADGTRLASGSRDTTVRVWDVQTQQQIYRGHRPQNLVTCLRWYHPEQPAPVAPPASTDATGAAVAAAAAAPAPGVGRQDIIIQGAEDLRVRIWDTRAGTREVAVLGGGTGSASAGSGTCGVLSEVQVLEGYVYFPLCLDVSPCGRYILTGSKGFNGVGAEARIWDLRGGRSGTGGSSAAAATSVGGSGAAAAPLPPSASAAAASVLRAAEFASAKPQLVRQYPGHLQDTAACAFVPQPLAWPRSSAGGAGGGVSAFLTASKDGSVRCWDRDTGSVISEYVDAAYAQFTSLAALPARSYGAAAAAVAADGGDAAAAAGASSGAGERRKSVGGGSGAGGDQYFAAGTHSGEALVFRVAANGSLACIARTQPRAEGAAAAAAP